MNLAQNEISLTPENPFFHRGPIRDLDYFFGRVEETGQTLNMLRKGQCVSIVGSRRIGKTSFMFHLRDPGVREEHRLGRKYLAVYVDCQGLVDLDKSAFYQWLWRETRTTLSEQGEADGWVESTADFRQFRDAMRTSQEKGTAARWSASTAHSTSRA